MPKYIHELKQWPAFEWDVEELLPTLTSVRHKQGRINGFLEHIGFEMRNETTLQNLALDVLKSSEIEGELLNPAQVRSSVARRLGMDVAGLIPADRNVDGIVDVMLDATQKFNNILDKERLCAWHSALFPTGRSGMQKITVGNWRENEGGPMQVVSGAMGKEQIHFEAPEANRLEKEMQQFLNWFNGKTNLDPVIKSGISHLWFVTIHPFDDGNGRIARAIADMQMTRADNDPKRFYSVSAQIRLQRNQYYDILERTQKGSLEITALLLWYLNCVDLALDATDQILKGVLGKTKFWDLHTQSQINERQRLLIDKLFVGFEGNLTSSKWAKIAKCSPDTALRDINDLIAKGILEKEASGGRSTSYRLIRS